MFENLKEKMLLRIERDCVKSELGGNIVYLKKSHFPLIGGEWQEINPPVNEDGTWNIINLIFGGKRNLTILTVILLIFGMVASQFYTNFAYVESLRNIPCVEMCLSNLAK